MSPLWSGSSLGGWLALQLALDHPHEVAGLLLIAPALDFTQCLWAGLSQQQQQDAKQQGRLLVSSKWVHVSQHHTCMPG